MQELKLEFENKEVKATSVTCLGMTFESDEARRAYFREELRRKLPELKQIEGFIEKMIGYSSVRPALLYCLP